MFPTNSEIPVLRLFTRLFYRNRLNFWTKSNIPNGFTRNRKIGRSRTEQFFVEGTRKKWLIKKDKWYHKQLLFRKNSSLRKPSWKHINPLAVEKHGFEKRQPQLSMTLFSILSASRIQSKKQNQLLYNLRVI